jgi:serine/threonine protein kinase
MDHYNFNLADLITAYKRDKAPIPRKLIKLYAYQLIKAIGYLDQFHICHRDIKPKNILIHKSTHQLAICDFGSAKKLDPKKPQKNTTYICTRWYRAPELLFGVKNYSSKIDIWAAGCIISEMLLKRP